RALDRGPRRPHPLRRADPAPEAAARPEPPPVLASFRYPLMNQPHRRSLAVAALCAASALLSACSTPQAPVNAEELPLFAGKLSPGLRLGGADFERELGLSGDGGGVP